MTPASESDMYHLGFPFSPHVDAEDDPSTSHWPEFLNSSVAGSKDSAPAGQFAENEAFMRSSLLLPM